MELIIFLKNGSQHNITLVRLKECGTIENKFFIENKKQGRIEIPLESIDSFKITKKFYNEGLYEIDDTVFYTAIAILSKQLT